MEQIVDTPVLPVVEELAEASSGQAFGGQNRSYSFQQLGATPSSRPFLLRVGGSGGIHSVSVHHRSPGESLGSVSGSLHFLFGTFVEICFFPFLVILQVANLLFQKIVFANLWKANCVISFNSVFMLSIWAKQKTHPKHVIVRCGSVPRSWRNNQVALPHVE